MTAGRASGVEVGSAGLSMDRGGTTLEAWQIILAIFVILLPMVLMVDYWGDERMTFRGRPILRPWQPQVEHAAADEDHH